MGSLIIVAMVLYVGDEHDILRLQVAALPRVSDQVDDLVVKRTKTALSGYHRKAVTHPHHFRRPHRR
jgi:hypothetical protein